MRVIFGTYFFVLVCLSLSYMSYSSEGLCKKNEAMFGCQMIVDFKRFQFSNTLSEEIKFIKSLRSPLVRVYCSGKKRGVSCSPIKSFSPIKAIANSIKDDWCIK